MPSSLRNRPNVYATLLDAIQYLDLKPGSIIKEQELAAQLGVSRTPVREALLRLSSEALIDIFPQRGTYVAEIDFNIAQETAYMRHLLDREVCLTLCRQRAPLQDTVEQQMYFMSLAVKKRQPVEYIKQDNAFHRAIFAAAGHEIIWNIISNSRAHYNRILTLEMQLPGILQKSYDEHQSILASIESGNATRLIEILERHHDHTSMPEKEKLLRSEFPDYFQ